MKVIYAVSPKYLYAIKEEIEPYSFSIQGYEEFELAEDGLKKTNAKDILGFVYLANDLPKLFQPLIDFIDACSVLSEPSKPFIIAVKNQKDINLLASKLTAPNIKLRLMTNFEQVTDKFIRNIILEILKESVEPYMDNTKNNNPIIDLPDPTLKYIPLIDPKVSCILDTIDFKRDVSDTLVCDTVLPTLKNNEDCYNLRKAYICAYYGMKLDHKELDDIVKKYKNTITYPFLICICNRIKEVERYA